LTTSPAKALVSQTVNGCHEAFAGLVVNNDSSLVESEKNRSRAGHVHVCQSVAQSNKTEIRGRHLDVVVKVDVQKHAESLQQH
jgi:hypothetical protein